MHLTDMADRKMYIPANKIIAVAEGHANGEQHGAIVWAGDFVFYVQEAYQSILNQIPPE